MFGLLAKVLRRDTRKPARPAPLRQRLQARIAVEELLPRVLLNASPVSVVSGHLLIHGTHGNDVVSVSVDVHNSGKLDVVDNGHAYVVNAKGVTEIELETNGGHDQFMNHTAIRALVETKDLTGSSETETSDNSADAKGAATSLEALLADPSGATSATGTADITRAGRLDVQVQGAAANSSFDVVIDGHKVGTITTDASGNGQLEIAPSGLKVEVGSTIAVGGLQGTFGTPKNA
jgi:hypothetical protein